ncbi:hypothetical protein FE394_12740 [Xenorhabdus sp. Reich]|uniref:Uncharacterized protein n=1 Tax=Xenorhabdus littoralis TaxID=2582835 RepID=A0ABU4SN17_9GAMM|nr:hypothetical protein [Xenorhabdus sp. Reich]MDX8000047.1 hypothetical protein [Xenorhabdus sp. Reich]
MSTLTQEQESSVLPDAFWIAISDSINGFKKCVTGIIAAIKCMTNVPNSLIKILISSVDSVVLFLNLIVDVLKKFY